MAALGREQSLTAHMTKVCYAGQDASSRPPFERLQSPFVECLQSPTPTLLCLLVAQSALPANLPVEAISGRYKGEIWRRDLSLKFQTIVQACFMDDRCIASMVRCTSNASRKSGPHSSPFTCAEMSCATSITLRSLKPR